MIETNCMCHRYRPCKSLNFFVKSMFQYPHSLQIDMGFFKFLSHYSSESIKKLLEVKCSVKISEILHIRITSVKQHMIFLINVSTVYYTLNVLVVFFQL